MGDDLFTTPFQFQSQSRIPLPSTTEEHSGQTLDTFLDLPDDMMDTTFSDTPVQDDFPGAARAYETGPTFMARFDDDEHAAIRRDHPYYPFASRGDWEVGSFLLSSGMSMARIDDFLGLDLVC
jgi:hypothetical protein